MKFSQLKAGLTTSVGEFKYIAGVEKDGTQPPQWKANVERYYWIITCRIDKTLWDLKFDYDNNYVSGKLCTENPSEYRRKLK